MLPARYDDDDDIYTDLNIYMKVTMSLHTFVFTVALFHNIFPNSRVMYKRKTYAD